MSVATGGIMARLREATSELHDSAENHAFQKALVRGELAVADYVRFLSQMLLVHRRLEGHLRARMEVMPFSAVLRERQFREALLTNDLAHFAPACNGGDGAPLPATDAVLNGIDETAGRAPAGLLGFHYVLEGSTNGAKFIAASVRRAYGLTDGLGASYFDPYGDNQRAYWAEFKRDMDAIDFTNDEADAMIAAARSLFRGMARLSEELM